MIECNQCGKCCIKYSNGDLSASASEIAYWETNKPDIFRFVGNGKIWVDPENGRQLALCPWLEKLPNQNKYICSIYYDRPDDCKYYPSNVEEMAKDGCEMLENKDLASPKQAQKILDILMAASRPHNF